MYAAFGTKGAILESVLDAMEHEADVSAVAAAMQGASVTLQRDALASFVTQLFTKGADSIDRLILERPAANAPVRPSRRSRP